MKSESNYLRVGGGLLAIIALLLLVVFVSRSLRKEQGAEEGLSNAWVLHWHREGGFAGFCDDVTLYASGQAIAAGCRSNPATIIGEARLTADEQATLDRWRATYKSWTHTQTDPATADAMTVIIEFEGSGAQTPDEATLQLMDSLAQQLLSRAKP